MRPTALFLLSLLLFFSLAAAPGGAPGAPEPHPDIPDHAGWVRSMLAVTAVLFVAAIPIGLMVRYNMKPLDEPTPDAHAAHAGHAHEPHGHH